MTGRLCAAWQLRMQAHVIRPGCAAQVLDEPGLLAPTHSTRLTLGGSGAKAQSSCCG